MSSLPNRVVLDIETQRTFEEVGGREHREQLGVSYVGVYSYSQKQFYGFFEKDLAALERILLAETPVIIGFNSIHFDIPVLQPYFSKLNLTTLPQLDILQEISTALGHRLKLESVALGTLASKKSGSGLDAIRWYREGDFDSLARYCQDDVRLTRDLYEYGCRHGKLFYFSGGEKLGIPISWGEPPLIAEKIEEAFKRRRRLEIEYMEVDESGQQRTVPRSLEVLSFEDDRFSAYCHTIEDQRTFFVPQVWNVRDSGETFARQGKLF